MDDDKRYNVILTGRLRPQHRRADVVAAIARLYRVDPARIEHTFARAPRVIKPAVSRRKATKYLLALGRAGAEVVIEPVASAAIATPVSGVRSVSDDRAVADPGTSGSPIIGPDQSSAPASALESALLLEPDSLPLTHGSGRDRARLLATPLVALIAGIVVLLGIGAGGWYLLSVGEPTISLPAPTVVTASGDQAISPTPDTATDAEFGPDADPVASVAPDGPARGRSAAHDTLPEALAAPADPDPAPAGSIASLAAPLVGPAPSDPTAAARNTTDVNPGDGLSALDLAAPFGLRMGESIEQLPGAAEPIAGDQFRLAAVREPLATFTDYGVRIGPDRGVCGVWASATVAETAADGVALRAAFDAMESALSNRVGPAARTDVLLAASSLTAPDAWMQALERRQRYLFSVWSGLSGARLPADVRRVTLRAGAESESAGRVNLEIAFRNEAACDATAGDAVAGGPSFPTRTTQPNPSQHSADE